MIVCGIDPSLTSTGIAVLRDGEPLTPFWSLGHEVSGCKSDRHRRNRVVSQAHAVTGPFIGRNRKAGYWPDLVVVEKPLAFGPSGSADGYDRYALWLVICAQFDAAKVPVADVHNQTRCKFATGKGGKSSKELTSAQHKREVLEAVRADWSSWAAHIRNDDIADALTLAAMGALYLGDPLPIRVPEWRRNGLKSVAWPEGVRSA